jgi:hypothetical protein
MLIMWRISWYYGLWGILFNFEVSWSSIGGSYKAKSIWDNVIKKIERQLGYWKRVYLFKGGRLTLINSTLTNFITYIMPLFPQLLSIKGSKCVIEELRVCSSSKKHAAELGLRLSEHFPRVSEGGAPIYSFVSKSQMGYTRRVKEKMARQLHKNKELFAEVVAETMEKGVENYSEVVQDVVKFTSIMGLSCGEGGDEKSLLNLFSAIEEERYLYTPKVKGKRELKNLECSINYEARGRLYPKSCQRRQGCVGSKNSFSFLLGVH